MSLKSKISLWTDGRTFETHFIRSTEKSRPNNNNDIRRIFIFFSAVPNSLSPALCDKFVAEHFQAETENATVRVRRASSGAAVASRNFGTAIQVLELIIYLLLQCLSLFFLSKAIGALNETLHPLTDSIAISKPGWLYYIHQLELMYFPSLDISPPSWFRRVRKTAQLPQRDRATLR